MANNFKRVIDRPYWVQTPPAPNAHAVGGSLTTDLRNDISRNPFVYNLISAAILNRYNAVTKAWSFLVNPGLGGTFGAGAGAVFAPSMSLIGAIAAGATTLKITVSAPITSVGANMLANRGGSGDYGFKIRITGNAAGSSGKIEERWITGNTAGTTPTISFDIPLTFTPVAGDAYEIIGGKVYLMSAGAIAATSWRSYEVTTNTLASLSNTNLPATISTEHSSVALDEQYVPYNHLPGEGFVVGTATYDANGTVKRCLLATATAAGTISGQASGGDFGVLTNEYRNFQIRIVEDTAAPTAVGQRRIIASHTGGTLGSYVTPVYTLGGGNWTVQPSANAKFVIEYPNLILVWSTATAVTYTYNYTNYTINNGTNSIAANAWHVTYFGNRGGNMAAGCTTFQSFGIQPDVDKNARHSFIWSFRGGATTLDKLDIAGGTTGAWSAAVVYDGLGMATPTTGSCGNYAPFDNEGKFGYMNIYVASALNQIYRFDIKNGVLTPFTPTGTIQAGTAVVGDRIAPICAIDGDDKYTLVYLINHLSTIGQEIIVQV